MEYRKNDIVTLKIEDCGIDGEGIGKADGFTVFVKDAVIGDTVRAKIMKAKKNYGYGRLEEIITPSPDRVEPKCQFARQCGGCQLQALSYEKQLEFKTSKVRGHLERIGGFTDIPMEKILGMEQPFHYRNKAQFPVGKSKDGRIITGFYAGRTHSIIENRDCALGVTQNKEVLDRVIAHMEKFNIQPYDENTGKGLVRHVLIRYGFFTDEMMVCLIINGEKLPGEEALVKSLCQIPETVSVMVNVNKKRNNVILGEKVRLLWGQPYITDKIGEISYQISPLSFFQVNPYQTGRLYGKALEYAQLSGNETVWDLYCGIGTISLFLAQKAKMVRGVEIIPAAIENAKENACLNGFANTEFFVGKAEEVLPEQFARTGERADVIVVDPPRKGCDETLLSTIIEMQPDRVVYVSCDSATLARDLKYLCERGYELKKVCPVDMFPNTVSVETVVLLSQYRDKSTCLDERGSRQIEMQASRLASLLAQKPDDTIEIDLDLDELDATSAELKATYQEIKDYVLKEFGLKVSSLYISQVKRKCGIEVGENYNLPKSENARVPQCPKEKEDAIKAALKYYAMI
ncbi:MULTISPECIES: 23S rRNA (uracil(1939)-C(5))-methyltransferase RlmD [Clostridia]|uniref:23S rRNA (uracil(1939)-C(5))-methyltransferase RlmD n=1 Tax=Clostridia TaxID=186801 RepID=UPI00156EEB49|nr:MULTISPECIES: 23S rRNA (uracil(1939)-C(5))-methyltransferase RlmD [Clostridia]MDB8778521.1 23S rRNA (uracil(1939)-C(5))-methyltransferase RlmD [Ruminococcus sp. 1001136sp1]MDB8785871.1 23S rRNA (uracil(1939)-C(5))-methyltransferase RlmD [Ruminococcus sp. 1001136sp1]NSD37487.1 23S rRNA (uracil(1939)-C(5))-methyltransferase RlmD [Blautia glucerasea]